MFLGTRHNLNHGDNNAALFAPKEHVRQQPLASCSSKSNMAFNIAEAISYFFFFYENNDLRRRAVVVKRSRSSGRRAVVEKRSLSSGRRAVVEKRFRSSGRRAVVEKRSRSSGLRAEAVKRSRSSAFSHHEVHDGTIVLLTTFLDKDEFMIYCD
ncbi:hypothetical protein ElyMa_002635700 [Elysia marginata]|uniref:Uncharacterized protein n=1 Tax=Elysia marginata TaxID=1093978 RepID=A0AAV4H6G2_9GAST|nr:hypothetical protein ElyMa_002635700 [Elysia marginata]